MLFSDQVRGYSSVSTVLIHQIVYFSVYVMLVKMFVNFLKIGYLTPQVKTPQQYSDPCSLDGPQEHYTK